MYMHKVKIVLRRRLSAKQRKHTVNMVFKTGLSTKMDLHDHSFGTNKADKYQNVNLTN